MKNHDEEKTMIFTPIEEKEKPLLPRQEEPLYNDDFEDETEYEEYEEERDSSSKKNALIYTALILVIIAIIAGTLFIILSGEGEGESPEKNSPGTEEEVPPIPEDEEKTVTEEESYECNVIFYGETAVEKDGAYTVTARIFDGNMENESKKHLTVDEKTQIKINGDRLEKESFIYLIEGKDEDELVFSAEITESGHIISISFDGEINEEEGVEGTDETGENNSGEENKHEIPIVDGI